eukprot:scaffold57019_cov69-Phaeocystis_antarctica.AAC.1
MGTPPSLRSPRERDNVSPFAWVKGCGARIKLCLESMQADGVLEYIVDHAVGVDVTASSLASRYDVSVKLGEGAFSQVWRGQRRDGGGGGDECALKCIGLESLDDDDEALEMLANEVAALRAAASGLGEEQRKH